MESVEHEQKLRLLEEVLKDLGLPQKTLPSKLFYDAVGAALFERICELQEYYPTRTETSILEDHLGEISSFLGRGCRLIELGSGSGRKTRLLLDSVRPCLYVPIDISCKQLINLERSLLQEYPWLSVASVNSDYMRQFDIPMHSEDVVSSIFFPGTTIGNLDAEAASSLMYRLSRNLGRGAKFVIGVDLKKSKAVLDAAYNDALGVTAQFNINILQHVNNIFASNFRLDQFAHLAYYSEERGQIEMHLESTVSQRVDLMSSIVEFRKGETILTEISRKFTVEEFQSFAIQNGWKPIHAWTDSDGLFSIHGLESI